MRVGMIGGGNLGRAIAARLRAQGFELACWNRTPEKLREAGFAPVARAADVATDVPLVVLSLFDDAAVEAVLTGSDGLLRGDIEGKIVLDTTTLSVAGARRMHALVRGAGAFYLEAPVLGSTGPAARGELVALVSGDAEILDEARPVLGALAATIHHFDAPGAASAMKLANNTVLGALMVALVEAVQLAEAAGIPRDQALTILDQGAGRSMLLAAKREALAAGAAVPAFSAAALRKDLGYASELARACNVPLFAAGLAEALFAQLVARGDGAADISAVGRRG